MSSLMVLDSFEGYLPSLGTPTEQKAIVAAPIRYGIVSLRMIHLRRYGYGRYGGVTSEGGAARLARRTTYNLMDQTRDAPSRPPCEQAKAPGVPGT
jgi:hypothetical protein